MPFGRKRDAGGRVTNFDSIYQKIIAPAVAQAGLEPVRADEEKIGGTIHKPMFERLMLCHYAVADITGANPNVFYELGIRLGRIYKDRWEIAKEAKRPVAQSLLRRAIDTYLDGFQADWRDAYPGVNAVSLMELQDKPDERQEKILPVVRYSATRKAQSNPDYWDYATLMELAVLGRDEAEAEKHLSEALGVARASWELESTAGNLVKIRKARAARGEDTSAIERLEQELLQAAEDIAPPKSAT